MEKEKDTVAAKWHHRAKKWQIFWHLSITTLLGAVIGIVGFLSVWQWYLLVSDLPMFIGTHPVEWRWFLNLALISGTSGAVLGLIIGIFRLEHVIDVYELQLEFDHRLGLISNLNKENKQLKDKNLALEVKIGDIGTAKNADTGTLEDTTANLEGDQTMIAELKERNVELVLEAEFLRVELARTEQALLEVNDEYVFDADLDQKIADLERHVANLEQVIA